MKLAKLLLISKNPKYLWFMSLLNRRVFSLAFVDDYFQFVELDIDIRDPHIMKFLYTGRDVEEVKKVIVKEVCDVE